MTVSVKVLDSALDDIEQLYAYLHERWGEDAARDAYVDLMDKLALLEAQPHMGSVVQELVQAGHANYRMLVHKKQTKVLYQLDEQNEVIYVHMVFSSKQDFQTLLYNRIMRFK
jgi:plasmid stabilization system protein ParE